jgi:hypothetical protein
MAGARRRVMPRQKRVNRGSPPLRGMTLKNGNNVKILTEKEMSEQKKDRLKSWITFYRRNPSYFIEHYMGVKLFPYQRLWVNLISRSTEFLGIDSRASAKSWVIAVYSIARCILYPSTIVALASSTKAQAGLIISEKCRQLYEDHENIRRECSNIVSNQNTWEMTFHNGSKINVVLSGEGGRGHRSHVTVLEERRLIPTVVIDSIIRPFLVSRHAPYLKNPKYTHLREEPQEIIITSAYYKSSEWYPEAKRFLKQVAAGDPDVKFMFLDYLISLKHGIKTKKQMIKEKETLDPITYIMEYGNIPYGSSSLSFYKMGLFNRVIKRPWRPIREETLIADKKNIYNIAKLTDEVRIVSVDVAMRAGATNDNTIITCARLLPTRKGWQTEICYLESHNGKNTTLQALRIKQIYEEFVGDVLVIDLLNAGISVFDSLTSVTKDEIRGVEYPAYTVLPDDNVEEKLYNELIDRTLGADAKPCIFPIIANAQFNARMAVELKDRLKRGLVKFLVDDNTAEEFLIKSGNKDILDQEETGVRAYLLQPHLNTTLMINESIALDMVMNNGILKLVEPEGARKDRYSSLSYLNHYVSLMDTELLKHKEEESGNEWLEMFQVV